MEVGILQAVALNAMAAKTTVSLDGITVALLIQHLFHRSK